jgi:HEAT repeat protein/outer membrane protein assembly factor BamB
MPAVIPAPAAETDTDLKYAEKALQEAKIQTDGPSLLQYFRARTLSEADKAKLAGIVRQLGSRSYKVRAKASRDLLIAGRAAIPFLRPALHDPDVEIVRRAEELLRRIESGSDAALATAAAQLVAARKPDGATRVLLAFLPFADDDMVQEALWNALAAVGLKNGKPSQALLAAAQDKEATLRAAAAFVLGRAGADHRPMVRRLLKDTDVQVRYQAASALVEAGDKTGVDTLIAFLGDGPKETAWQAEDILCRLAGDDAPASPETNDAAGRQKWQKGWEAWWQKNGGQIDLAKLNLRQALRGLTIVVEHDGAGKDSQGRIWARGRDGKVRWELNSGMGGPLDVHLLPGKRLLVGEYMGHRVTERELDTNKILWEKKVTSSVVACQRLPNGNTFIASFNQLLEVTRDGKTVLDIPRTTTIYYAQKLRNGHILYADSVNKIGELDEKGKELWSANVPGSAWGGLDRLPNGHYLVCLYGGGKVVEVDNTGKVFWQQNAPSPTRARRLPNGHTVIGCSEGRMVVEYDRNGRELWSHKTQGRVWCVRRY